VTLVEVLIASVVLLIVMVPMGILLTSVTSASASARQHEAALQLADSWVEILSNSQPPPGVNGGIQTNSGTPVAPAGTQAPSSTLAGTTFTVTAAYNIVSVKDLDGTESDLCSAGEPPSPTHPGVIQLKVTVYWDNGNQQLSVTTEINYPKPGLQTEGFLAINVANNGENDVNGNSAENRLLALPVTITQLSGSPTLTPNPYTVYPDGNGCIFAQVPVGTYDVAIEQPTEGTPAGFFPYSGTPPFVNTSGSTTDQALNQQVTVTAEQVVNLGAFDEGITADIGYGGASAVDGGVECPGTASIPCITFGNGTTGATAAWGGTSSPWTSTNLAAGTQINQVACTTATSAYCVGVGYGPSGGMIESTPSDLNSLRSDNLPSGAGVTDLAQVSCLSTNGCYALGLSGSGPVVLAGRVGAGTDTWTVVAHPGVTFSSLNSIACPTATTCEVSYTGPGSTPGILRLDGDPASLALLPLWQPTVTSDGLPSAVQSVGTITCPTTTTCEATATGDQSIPSDATVITAPIGALGPDAWVPETQFPTGATSVSGISCTSTTCVAIGTATGVPAVWSGAVTGTTHSWVQSNTFPNGLEAVTSVACGQPATSDSASCVVAGISASTSASGTLLDGSETGGSWAWNPVPIPSGDTVQYYLGVACESPPSASSATCAAVGATPNGPAVLTTGSGPSGSWSDQTPATLNGLVVTGIPLETEASGTTDWTTLVAQGATSNATTLPSGDILYPFAGGYSIAAGDCAAEPTTFVSSVANLVAPAGGVADVTVPLQLLPLKLVNSSGVPDSGATVTLTSTTCPTSDSYNLPPTDATGVTTDSVPYGTYAYTVTKGTSAVAHTNITITVGPNSIQIAGGSAPGTVYLPGTVQVSA
jgi:type II secretory pathway pseudopilin PulG